MAYKSGTHGAQNWGAQSGTLISDPLVWHGNREQQAEIWHAHYDLDMWLSWRTCHSTRARSLLAARGCR